jgi:cystathionine gamma-synthase
MKEPNFATKCTSEPYENDNQSLLQPVYQTSTFVYKDSQQVKDFFLNDGKLPVSEYTRYLNPTVRAVENKLSTLEQSQDCLLTASGSASLNLVLQGLCRPGTGVLLLNDSYRGTWQLCGQLEMRGQFTVYSAENNVASIEKVLNEHKEIKLVIGEIPSNPRNRLFDIEAVAKACKQHKAKLIIDATLATPYNCLPLKLGADLVMHSATKYLSGHNDVLAGALLGKQGLIQGLRELHMQSGAVLDPSSAFLLSRGLKTLALRMERQNFNAMALASYLEGSSQVKKVWYCGLTSHPDHDLAKKQMNGFGSVVSFELKASDSQVTNFLNSLKLPRIAASLGGVETLIQQPGLFSYSDLTIDERNSRGLGDNFFRLAVGIEDIVDLKEDLGNALQSV